MPTNKPKQRQLTESAKQKRLAREDAIKQIVREYKEGGWVSEQTIIDDLELPRSLVREAMAVLRAAKFIESEQGRGSWMQGISRHGIEEAFECRKILEPGLAWKLCEKDRNLWLPRIRDVLDDLNKLIESCKDSKSSVIDDISIADLGTILNLFHRDIVRLAENSMAAEWIDQLDERFSWVVSKHRHTRRSLLGIKKELNSIVDAILNKAPYDEVEAAFAAHFDKTLERWELIV